MANPTGQEMREAVTLVAERMGYDAGRNMPNTENCHFALFATTELCKAWERGKKRGDAEREQQSDIGQRG